MAKRLTIVYGDVTLYDDEPAQFSWSEKGESIEIKAGPEKANPLAELLEKSQRGKRPPLRSVDTEVAEQ